MTVFFHALFYSTLVPMFTVLDPLLEFTYHLLFSWRKFALCIQSLLCMLFLFGWPPCQRSDMILMEVSQHAYDMIHNISGLFGYFYVCEIYINLIWYLYLFMLNKFCLSLSLAMREHICVCMIYWNIRQCDVYDIWMRCSFLSYITLATNIFLVCHTIAGRMYICVVTLYLSS